MRGRTCAGRARALTGPREARPDARFRAVPTIVRNAELGFIRTRRMQWWARFRLRARWRLRRTSRLSAL
jgi:hypothetical protein